VVFIGLPALFADPLALPKCFYPGHAQKSKSTIFSLVCRLRFPLCKPRRPSALFMLCHRSLRPSPSWIWRQRALAAMLKASYILPLPFLLVDVCCASALLLPAISRAFLPPLHVVFIPICLPMHPDPRTHCPRTSFVFTCVTFLPHRS